MRESAALRAAWQARSLIREAKKRADLDGLLFNTEELYQFVGTELMRRRGKTFEQELIQKIMGRPQPVAPRQP